MTSLYDSNGKGILTAAGTLFHVMGSGDSMSMPLQNMKIIQGLVMEISSSIMILIWQEPMRWTKS